MRKSAIFAFMALIATLLVVAPASADHGGDPSPNVTASVLSNGTLRIIGDNDPNEIEVCWIDDETWAVGIGQPGGAPTIWTVYPGVTNDIDINSRNGDDHIKVSAICHGEDAPETTGSLGFAPHVLDELKVNSGTGDDDVHIGAIIVVDDVKVLLGRGDDGLDIEALVTGDHLRVRGDQGDDVVTIGAVFVNVNGDLNLGGGDNELNIVAATFERVSVIGGLNDDVNVIVADMGLNPVFDLKDGDDNVFMFLAGADGVFLIDTGGGDDSILDIRFGSRDFFWDIRQQAGDDDATVGGDIGPGDVFHGGSEAVEDVLELGGFGADNLGASITEYEVFPPV